MAKILAGLLILVLTATAVHGQSTEQPTKATPPALPADKSDDSSPLAALDRAIQDVAEEPRYRLAYQLRPETGYRWECEQTTSTQTRIAGESEKSSSRTQWTTRWQVQNLNAAGQMAFSSRVEQFSLWQQLDEKPAVVFSSTAPRESVPKEFATIADSLNCRPSRFTIASNGRVISQESSTQKQLVGFGDITIPLPEESVPVGYRWFISRQLTARDEDHSTVRIAARLSFELTKVKDRQAYLTFRTDVLTPGLSPTVTSQILQNLARGHIVFDLDEGIIRYRETEWNERIQAFAGPDSYLAYSARSIQRLVADLPPGVALETSAPDASHAAGTLTADSQVVPAGHAETPSSEIRPLQPIMPSVPAAGSEGGGKSQPPGRAD